MYYTNSYAVYTACSIQMNVKKPVLRGWISSLPQKRKKGARKNKMQLNFLIELNKQKQQQQKQMKLLQRERKSTTTI